MKLSKVEVATNVHPSINKKNYEEKKFLNMHKSFHNFLNNSSHGNYSLYMAPSHLSKGDMYPMALLKSILKFSSSKNLLLTFQKMININFFKDIRYGE